MLVAAAAMAFVSCQKETAPTQVEDGYISFTSANPETKTAWNGETIVWSVGDNIRVACQNNGTWYTSGTTPKAKLYASTALSSDALEQGAESVQFKVKTGADYFPTNLEGELQFYALYPSGVADASFDQDTSCESVKIATEQKVSSSTYDSSCDIMWGKAITTCESMPTDPLAIVWNRVVAHANITLNKIPDIVAGEKINTIKLTAQENAALAGTFDLNMATGEFSANSASNTITLTCDNIIADASGNVEFWACINPCTLTELDIEVDTDKAVYTIKKTGFSREFLVNQRNLLPINMSGATREEKELTGASLPFQQMFDSIDKTNSTALSALEGFVELEKVYPNTGAVRIGNTSSAGTLTTNLLNLSSDFYVRVMAKGYDADEVTLYVEAGGTTQTVDLITFGDAGFVEYVLNFDAIDGSEKVIFYTPSKVRVIVDEIEICEGSAVPQPTILAQTPEKVAANGGTGEIAYTILNPIGGEMLTAVSNQSWLTISSVSDNKVMFNVTATEEKDERSAEVALTYGTVSTIVIVKQEKAVAGISYLYTFTSNAWADATSSWTSIANGYQKKDQGISVTVAKTGAGASTKSSMTNVSKVIVTYCTNASSGAGSIQVSVNNDNTQTLNVTTDGGSSHRTLEFDYSQSKPTGVVSFKVNCTTNSIYIKSIEIIVTN